MSRRGPTPLPYPRWSPTIAKQLEGTPVVSMQLVWKPVRHYLITHAGGTQVAYVDSPSKVTGATEAKDGLVWWSAGLAADYLLENLESAYFEIECNPRDTGDPLSARSAAYDKWYREARKQHDTRKNDAAKLGNEVHNYIELCGRALFAGRAMPIRPAGISEQVAAGIDAFESWWQDQRLTVVGTEIPCCHPGLGFAGTIDKQAIDEDGHLVFMDWKTSSRVHPAYYRQVCAYTLAWEATHPDEPVVDAYIVRLGKEGEDAGKFEVHHLTSSDLDAGEKAFVASLELYRYTERIAARLKEN